MPEQMDDVPKPVIFSGILHHNSSWSIQRFTWAIGFCSGSALSQASLIKLCLSETMQEYYCQQCFQNGNFRGRTLMGVGRFVNIDGNMDLAMVLWFNNDV